MQILNMRNSIPIQNHFLQFSTILQIFNFLYKIRAQVQNFQIH